jgi:hypothetical protein
MKYTSAAAFRQALDQRLKNEAATSGLGVGRLRKRVAFELFLRRLLAVAPNHWVLKGALALDFRLAVTTRATKDIDFGREDDEQAAIHDITAAQQLALDDFFTFAATRTDELDNADEFSAIRFHVTAQLQGEPSSSSSSSATPRGAASPAVPTSAGRLADVPVRYLGTQAVQVRGAATGRVYRASSVDPLIAIDARDVAPLIRTGLFRSAASSHLRAGALAPKGGGPSSGASSPASVAARSAAPSNSSSSSRAARSPGAPSSKSAPVR